MNDTTDKHIPTIVYVEDNSGDALLLEEALRDRGHAVELLIIERGDKAMRYFEVKNTARDLPPPHCILLDSHLPLVTGAELVKFIRNSEVFRQTPVYIFASEREYREIAKTAPVSLESFLNKPSRWDQFLALADLLMGSTIANSTGTAASPGDDRPEVHATGGLRAK